MLIVKQFPVHKCGHEKQPIAASDCLYSLLKHNKEHYMLATQDHALIAKVDKCAGVPVLSMVANVMNLMKPSKASEKVASKQLKDVGTDKDEIAQLKQLKEAELGAEEAAVKKKKKAKGPNPLSVKKKKKGNQHEIKKTDGGVKKRKRNRSKLKMPKQMSKLLASGQD